MSEHSPRFLRVREVGGQLGNTSRSAIQTFRPQLFQVVLPAQTRLYPASYIEAFRNSPSAIDSRARLTPALREFSQTEAAHYAIETEKAHLEQRIQTELEASKYPGALSAAQVAGLLCVSRMTVTDWKQRGEIALDPTASSTRLVIPEAAFRDLYDWEHPEAYQPDQFEDNA